MRSRLPWFILLLGGVLGPLSCAPLPEQPNNAQPYALLVFPEEIRLVALDTQSVDPRARIKDIRVAPGPHRLRFTYAGRSLQHVGQQIDPSVWKPRQDISTSLGPGHSGSAGGR